MNLLDLATFVCTKVSQLEAADVVVCKSFLKRRFEMIWHDQLWKDSLFEYTQTLTPDGYTVDDTWLPVKQILLLPTQIKQVVAVRSADNKFNVVSSEQLYRMDWDAFQNTGRACAYRLLAPCVWEIEEAKGLRISVDGSDVGVARLVIDYLDSDRVTVDRFNDLADNPVSIHTERFDSFSKGVTIGAMSVVDFGDSGLTLFTAGATVSAMPKRQRIQLIGSVLNPTVIRVLGKTSQPTFEADTDELGLTGVENCLIAFVQADMWERERQIGKAQALKQEGVQLLDQLKRVQTVQQAHNKRIIPESGYGDCGLGMNDGGDLW